MPKIDIVRSEDKGAIIYKKSPGPKEDDIRGNLQERSMIGTNKDFQGAIQLFEDRKKRALEAKEEKERQMRMMTLSIASPAKLGGKKFGGL